MVALTQSQRKVSVLCNKLRNSTLAEMADLSKFRGCVQAAKNSSVLAITSKIKEINTLSSSREANLMET